MIAQQLAAMLPRPAAPAAPAATQVNGQRHMLAYITPQEAELLAARGGGPMAAPGMQLAHGLRAFSDGDGDGGGNDGNTSDGPSGPGQGDDGGYGGWGDANSAIGAGFGPESGGWGSPSDGGFGGGEGGNTSGAEGGNTSGASDDSGYGTTPGPAAPPPAAAPPPRDLAGEAEARVRARYGSSTGSVWLDALKSRFNEEAQGIVKNAYTTRRNDARDRLVKSGYDATPLGAYQLAGIDSQRDALLGGIGSKWDARAKDYQGRVNNSLAQAIAAARASLNPDAAESIADQYIGTLNADIAGNPGAAYAADFGPLQGQVEDPNIRQRQTTAADALQRALLAVGLTGATGASRVGS
jgi:hypothetical protein